MTYRAASCEYVGSNPPSCSLLIVLTNIHANFLFYAKGNVAHRTKLSTHCLIYVPITNHTQSAFASPTLTERRPCLLPLYLGRPSVK